MIYTVKWLVCVVTVYLALSEANAFPSDWKRDLTSLKDAGNAVHQEGSAPVAGVCNSHICHEDANAILASLDMSVDPCDDFYMFACGGWMEKRPPTNDTPQHSPDLELHKQLFAKVIVTLEEPISEDDNKPLKAAKKMYQVCVDVDASARSGVQQLVDLSNALGGWPMALEHWNEDNFSVESTLAVFERLLNWSPVFNTDCFISADFTHSSKAEEILLFLNDTTRRYLLLVHNGDDMPGFDLLDPKNEEKRVEYESKIVNTTLYLTNATGVTIDEETILIEARQIVEFITQLQNIRSKTMKIEMVTLGNVQNWTDSALVVHDYAQFNWLSYMNRILSDTDIVLDEDEEVVVIDTGYWSRLFHLLDNTPRRVIANYIQWQFINKFKSKSEEVMKDLLSNDDSSKRSMHCAEETMKRLNHAINSRLVLDIYTEQDRKHFNILVENLRSEFISVFSNVTWLDDDHRSKVMERIETMNVYSGYPEWYTNATAVLDYYKQVNVSSDHFTNMLMQKSEHYHRSLPLLRYTVYEGNDVWLSLSRPEAINAFYDLHPNYLLISLGHLQSFYIKVGRLEAVHYGRLGAIVGHEMMHGVTTTYGEEWNTNTSNLFYNEQCFVEQYEKYPIPELEETVGSNITLNGTATLQENVGDIFGLAAAYEAYQTYVKHHGAEQSLPGLEEYTAAQLFFISFGMSWCESRTNASMDSYLDDAHSPSADRVRGSVTNIAHFAEAFNCPTGSNMNPVEKCRVW